MSLDLDAIRARTVRYAQAIGPGGEKAWAAGQLAADVPTLLAEIERLTGDRAFWADRCNAVERVLDVALGPDEGQGTGQGIAADVALLARQRDDLRAERNRFAHEAREWRAEAELRRAGLAGALKVIRQAYEAGDDAWRICANALHPTDPTRLAEAPDGR